MITGFKEYFSEVAAERASQIGIEAAKSNLKYQHLSKRIIQKETEVLSYLTADVSRILEEYIHLQLERSGTRSGVGLQAGAV